MSNQDSEDLSFIINNRNTLYVDFFKEHLPDRYIRFTGNPQAPVIVIDNQYMANSYIKNSTIFFTDGKPKGEVIHTFKLKTDVPNRFDNDKIFMDWFSKYPMRKCFTIRFKNTDLYVSGSQIYDQGKRKRYPVFCEINPSIFYTKKYAQKIIDEYTLYNTLPKGIELEII